MAPKEKKTKYYAIKKGRIPGIYNDWNEAKKQIEGFPGAVYKSFTDLDSARLFMGFIDSKDLSEKSIKKFKKDVIYIFTDGSYNTKTKKSAYGFYVPELEHLETHTNTETNNYNEMLAIVKALEFVIELGITQTISIHSDSLYAVKLIKNNYKNWIETGKINESFVHKDLLKQIYELSQDIDGDIEIEHIKAHTNNLDDFSRGNNIIDNAVQEKTK